MLLNMPGRIYTELSPEYMKIPRSPHSICSVGVAGKFGYANSDIVFNDMSQRPCRYDRHGGLGTVMASKGLKFIIPDDRQSFGVTIIN
jgi:aldehyde:ferredoxin oxidoreductase